MLLINVTNILAGEDAYLDAISHWTCVRNGLSYGAMLGWHRWLGGFWLHKGTRRPEARHRTNYPIPADYLSFYCSSSSSSSFLLYPDFLLLEPSRIFLLASIPLLATFSQILSHIVWDHSTCAYCDCVGSIYVLSFRVCAANMHVLRVLVNNHQNCIGGPRLRQSLDKIH